MNGKIGAVAAAIALLVTGCGVVHVHFGSSGGAASTRSGTYQQALAYAQCMRGHGLPGFPLPNPSGSTSYSGQPAGGPGSPAVRANDACEHLLPADR
jgi:uncharacterized protein YceK